MTTSTKEFLYFTATLVAALLGSVWIFGYENLKEGDLVLNVHDTYFVIRALHFLAVFVPLVFVLSYGIRILFVKFRSKVSYSIFLITNGFLILFLLSLVINNPQPHFKLGYRFWMILSLFLILELFAMYGLLKTRAGSNR
ncbi:hypothetical protein [Flavobacterium sp.]|uniref:hypothetical protein n=1 Tax=Flavobacterium sp. TaxID=239 RepID=UPI0039E2C834